MKIVEFNGTHKLFYQGYTHGLRFTSMSWEVRDLINKVKERYGIDESKWTTYRSRRGRPLWIGFKDQKIISFVLML